MSVIDALAGILSKKPKAKSSGESEPEVAEQADLKKFIRWGAALVVIVGGALVQATPLSDARDFTLPAEFAALIVTVLLLVFVFVEGRPVRFFDRVRTFLLLALSIGCFLWLQSATTSAFVKYEGEVFLKGSEFTQLAAAYRSSTNPRPIDADVLHHFNGRIERVWTEESIESNRRMLTLLYLAGVSMTGLTIIAAFNVLRAGTRKQIKKTGARVA